MSGTHDRHDICAEDARWMQAALEWSRRGRGWTSPRPSVGCVLVRDGRMLSGAHTQPGHGNPHAEIAALRAATAAGEDTRGATCYVTLEPCCHYGTTPPCTDALIQAGITRVVAGVTDPNRAVSGRGFAQLRAAGIEVVNEFMADECARVHEDFLKYIVAQQPFVTLKCAISLDGKIATRSGESKWITGEAARRRAHVLRHEHDAVLVGIGTVLADDPQLTVRLDGRWKQPARVVLDSSGRLPLSARVLEDVHESPLYVAVGQDLPLERHAALEAAGAQLLRAPSCTGRVALPSLCQQLYERGICSILIEGGAQVAGAALDAGIVDKVAFFVAPMLIPQGRDVLAGVEVARLEDSFRLHDIQVEQLDNDVMISGVVHQRNHKQCLQG